MANVKLKISLNQSLDETSSVCNYVAPDHHYLESWGDAEAKRGCYSLIQPTINPLFNTRQAPLSLLIWADSASINKLSDQPYYEYLKSNWQSNILSKGANASWDKTLHDGYLEAASSAGSAVFSCNVNEAVATITKSNATGTEVEFYESHNLGSGQYANNPWLMELPDPITRSVWGNYLAVSVKFDGDRRFIVSNGVKKMENSLVLMQKEKLSQLEQLNNLDNLKVLLLLQSDMEGPKLEIVERILALMFFLIVV